MAINELTDGVIELSPAGFEGLIRREPGLRPESPLVKGCIELATDPCVTDIDQPTDEFAMVTD